MADVRQCSFKCELEKNQMRKTLMVSVAVAALLGATGLATAQGVNQGGVKGSEPPAAASPKGDTAAPMKAPAAKGDATATPGPASKEERAPQHTQGKPDAKTTGEMKADGKTKAPDSTTTSKDLKSPTAETKPSASDSKTTGNAATSATVAPPAEKRTQITSAIKQEKVEEVTNVNFNVSIGTAVPAGVRYHPLPSRIVDIYPEWRGYDFILVRGKYIILRPHTHEIVYIIEG
jgi:outer membrane biosynthesis protein TonB